MQVLVRTVDAALEVPRPLRWLAVLLWAGMIFLLSNQPGLRATDDPVVERPIRIVAHILTYTVLAVVVAWAATGRRSPTLRVIAVAAAAAFVYGITDEWHQSFVPSRTGNAIDLVWDLSGVLVAAALLLFARHISGRDRA